MMRAQQRILTVSFFPPCRQKDVFVAERNKFLLVGYTSNIVSSVSVG